MILEALEGWGHKMETSSEGAVCEEGQEDEVFLLQWNQFFTGPSEDIRRCMQTEHHGEVVPAGSDFTQVKSSSFAGMMLVQACQEKLKRRHSGLVHSPSPS
jgi:hypothetical protein